MSRSCCGDDGDDGGYGGESDGGDGDDGSNHRSSVMAEKGESRILGIHLLSFLLCKLEFFASSVFVYSYPDVISLPRSSRCTLF